MLDADTTMGGSARTFQPTPWTPVTRPPDALEHLCRRYWKAVYTYIRVQWRMRNEDAKDLTQRFFEWFIESRAMERPQGRFRTFLRGALHHFLVNDYWAARAEKRGGQRRFVPIDEAAAELVAGESPEAAMDREWRRILVRQALDLLRTEYASVGREPQFRLFETYYFGPGATSHAAVAGLFGVTPTTANNSLSSARSRFRELVYDLVAESVTDPEGFRLEIEELFS